MGARSAVLVLRAVSSARSAGASSFYARLGAEAADALDEFLEHALIYERQETPTLQGFVAWLRAGDTQVKRDMDIARDEVRVMTVHGAKGLEAPIVILADTTTPPKGPKEPRLLSLPPANAAPGTPDRLVWAGRKADDVAPVAAARASAVRAAEDEYRRLLYVAMTRAADRLVVAGSRGVNRIPPGCWYELIESALKPDADRAECRRRRWHRAALAQVGGCRDRAVRPDEAAHAKPPQPLPDWLQARRAGAPGRQRARSRRRPRRADRHAAGDRKALDARTHRASAAAGAARDPASAPCEARRSAISRATQRTSARPSATL